LHYEQKSTYCISELPFDDDDVVVSIIGTWTLTFEGILAELDFKENGTVPPCQGFPYAVNVDKPPSRESDSVK